MTQLAWLAKYLKQYQLPDEFDIIQYLEEHRQAS